MAGRLWEVVGGAKNGGLVVKTGRELKSPEHSEGRLATGSIVAGLDLEGERLRYTLLAGSGPKDGWVSLKFKGSSLLIEAGAEGSIAAAEIAEMEEAKRRGGDGDAGQGRVWIMSQGTRGDVQPCVALGVGLRKAGYRVTILAGACFQRFVESYGLNYHEQGVDTKKECEQSEATFEQQAEKYQEDGALKVGAEVLHRLFGSEEVISKSARQLMTLLAKERPDAILTSGLNGIVAFLAWKSAGVPIYGLDFCPNVWAEDEFWKEVYNTNLENDVKYIEAAVGLNPLDCTLDQFIDWKMWRTYAAAPATVFDGILSACPEDQRPKATEEQLAKKRDLCRSFLVLDSRLQLVDLSSFGGFETLKKLQAYLDDGPPPVYIGWGSMPVPTVFLVKMLVALRMVKGRAVICAGWGGHTEKGVQKWIEKMAPDDPMGLSVLTKSMCFVDVAPHEWLLPRCACTVHHGGAGTTCAALRAGVPTLITPFLVDQFIYANWVEAIGVGCQLDLMANVEKLLDPSWSKTLRKVLNDKDISAKAKELGEKMRKEKAVDEMVDLVGTWVKESREAHAAPPAEKAWGYPW